MTLIYDINMFSSSTTCGATPVPVASEIYVGYCEELRALQIEKTLAFS